MTTNTAGRPAYQGEVAGDLTRQGIGAEVWLGIMLAVATAIGGAFAWLRLDVAYVAVLVWAFVAMAVKHNDNPLVLGASLLAALVLAGLLVLAWWRKR